jgi:hypothetical protein
MPFAFVQYFFQGGEPKVRLVLDLAEPRVQVGLRPTLPNRVKANEHFSTKLVDGVFF